jgi:hypothetical protein
LEFFWGREIAKEQAGIQTGEIQWLILGFDPIVVWKIVACWWTSCLETMNCKPLGQPCEIPRVDVIQALFPTPAGFTTTGS